MDPLVFLTKIFLHCGVLVRRVHSDVSVDTIPSTPTLLFCVSCPTWVTSKKEVLGQTSVFPEDDVGEEKVLLTKISWRIEICVCVCVCYLRALPPPPLRVSPGI